MAASSRRWDQLARVAAAVMPPPRAAVAAGCETVPAILLGANVDLARMGRHDGPHHGQPSPVPVLPR